MNYRAINFSRKFELFSERWAPKVVAQMNDYQFKLVKLLGDFVWHRHAHTDEVFIVIKGSMKIAFRDGEVALTRGEMFVVPMGVEHKPCASEECWALIVEPCGVVNTGDAGGDRTAPNDVWI